MFATLLGTLPRPPLSDDAAPEALLDAVLELQSEHGLEPATDGGWSGRTDPVTAWQVTASRADRLIKAIVRGPWSSGRTVETARRELVDLADAGCAWIEIHEPAVTTVGTDPDARARFAEDHRALTAGLDGVHLSLAVLGGAAAETGIETVLAGAYASLALDLIDGPDNWRLATAAPGDRGIVCGALATRPRSDDGPELLLWAAGYAASTQGRGSSRVGLATAGSLAALPWKVAARKVERLGVAARLAAAPADERRRTIDPRAVDIRSAALGRYAPRSTRSGRRPTTGQDRPGDGDD